MFRRLAVVLLVVLVESGFLLGVSTLAYAKRSTITKPGVPTRVIAFPFDQSTTVVWTPPSSDGGDPITGYIVDLDKPMHRCTTTGATSCTLTGLRNGHFYGVHVRAISAKGESRRSNGTSVAPSIPECDQVIAGAHLTLPNLDGCDFANLDLSPINLLAPVLFDANLSNANLSGSYIFNSDFYGANLSGADLLNVDFADGETLTDVTWSNTTCPDGTNSNSDGGTCANNLTP